MEQCPVSRYLVVDEEKMRPDYWFELLLWLDDMNGIRPVKPPATHLQRLISMTGGEKN